MNKYRKYLVMIGIVIITGIISPLRTNAQIPPDGSCDPMDPACPIDGGISLLIAAGIGLGARRAMGSSRNKES